MHPFKVKLEDAVSFSKVWNYKGISVPLDEVHCQFASDYANIVIRSFIEFTLQQAAAKKAELEAKPLVSLE